MKAFAECHFNRLFYLGLAFQLQEKKNIDISGWKQVESYSVNCQLHFSLADGQGAQRSN